MPDDRRRRRDKGLRLASTASGTRAEAFRAAATPIRFLSLGGFRASRFL